MCRSEISFKPELVLLLSGQNASSKVPLLEGDFQIFLKVNPFDWEVDTVDKSGKHWVCLRDAVMDCIKMIDCSGVNEMRTLSLYRMVLVCYDSTYKIFFIP